MLALTYQAVETRDLAYKCNSPLLLPAYYLQYDSSNCATSSILSGYRSCEWHHYVKSVDLPLLISVYKATATLQVYTALDLKTRASKILVRSVA